MVCRFNQVYFFLETFKMLKSMSEMFNFSCLLLVKQYFSHLSHSIPSFDTYFPANQKRSYTTIIFKTNLTLG